MHVRFIDSSPGAPKGVKYLDGLPGELWQTTSDGDATLALGLCPGDEVRLGGREWRVRRKQLDLDNRQLVVYLEYPVPLG